MAVRVRSPGSGQARRRSDRATSIDAFAIGLSIALLNVPVLLAVVMIGLVSLVLSILGLLAGIRLGATFGKRMEILGGLILIGIGVRVVVTHLLP